MVTSVETGIESIGEVAGKVWHCLDRDGNLSYAQLVKQVGLPRDLVMQAIGWLAREERYSSRPMVAPRRSRCAQIRSGGTAALNTSACRRRFSRGGEGVGR